MSIRALSDYTIYSRYSHYLPEKKRRETWDETVTRVYDMHREKYKDIILTTPELLDEINFAESQQKKKRVLASQRSLQFAGKPIFQHNLKLYNCFTENTEFVTDKGVKMFSDFMENDEISVLTHDGSYQTATVKSYGTQNFNKIKIARSNSEYVCEATENHRWLLKDGTETTNLKVGDYLLSTSNIFNAFDYDESEDPLEKLYWCYGFVYGDGTVTGNKYSMVRLCGKDARFEYRFKEMGFSSSSSASLKGDVICFTGKYQKTSPNPETDSPNLIRAFVRGYLDADGEKDNKGQNPNQFTNIVTVDEEHANFIRRCFPIAGVFIISEKDISDQITNFGKRREGTKLFRLRNCFDRENKFSQPFRVISIEKNSSTGKAWCLEVEQNRSFILKNGVATGNCTSIHIDRPRAIQEILYILLCGAGAGFSVQKHHIKKLPKINPVSKELIKHVIADSIEGWADALGALMASYFESHEGMGEEFKQYKGKLVSFDYSLIRPQGALIAGQFKAPGPLGLRKSLEKIRSLIEKRVASENFNNRLRPIDAYDIIMHASDAVLSGGVRRSACLCQFSHDDEEMMTAKTGNWFIENPQRARSNNSAVLIRGKVSREEFANLMKSTKEFGEPAFIWLSDPDIQFNPCVEISMYPILISPKSEYRKSGVSGCNLTEINGKYCTDVESFLQACRASAIIGTLQAGYTSFPYLGKVTEEIFKREALLGCSITGVMDNPDILLDPEIQKLGAEEVKKTNEKMAKILGINIAARATCVKPAGSTSCVLGTASGIHPHHARRYIRRVQANQSEFCLEVFEKINPIAVEKSVWSANGTDKVISFLCEVPPGAVTKNQVSAVDLLEKVKLTQQNWVEYGTREEHCVIPNIRHNVSNTIVVRDDEWDGVEKFIFDNQQWFAGVSLLPASGDLDYPQAPFSTVLTPNELVREYGDASVFASGLIVDGLKAFEDNLWKACDTILGRGEPIQLDCVAPIYPTKRNNKELAQYFLDKAVFDECFQKKDWLRRATQFADRYFEGNLRQMTYCLKYVSLWKTWCDLKRDYQEINWKEVTEEQQTHVNADTLGAQACVGAGNCDI